MLARHPRAELAVASSRSQAGTPLAKAMPKYHGLISPDLCFSGAEPVALAKEAVDVWFLALPHGVAAEFARPLVAAGRRVIDLSADFRLRCPDLYKAYYDHEHPGSGPAHGRAVRDSPTAQRGLEKRPAHRLPRLLPDEHPDSADAVAARRAAETDEGLRCHQQLLGVSGAGKKAETAYLYCEREGSIKGYGMPRHRHLSEIEENLSEAAGTEIVVQFNPHLAPMIRGIATTITVLAGDATVDGVYAAWNAAYRGRPFVGVLPSGTFPDTAHVAGTNRCDISAVHDRRSGNLVITSAIDNLLKGAEVRPCRS